ncbi:MAG: alanine:cation symporter family protein [Bacteroidetes bacterium]|nr:alanine:cation symporter family protein [Bacteroidota bacterium]
MLTQSLRPLFIIIACLIAPALAFTQDSTAAKKIGIDEKIDRAFQPVAQGWEDVVMYPVNLGGQSVPIVVILLVCGALFFTLRFSFVNLRQFGLATRVVRGKYDELEKSGAAEVAGADKDIPHTIRDESHHGEVNHFQALATAVSGTVGLGNIAGVAIAIAMGGPGATFWMIICGLLGMSSKFVECTLGVKYRDINKDGTVFGGPMYYLSKGFAEKGWKNFGKILAAVFAIFCIGGSLGGGNAFQANQATQQIVKQFNIGGSSSGFFIGVILAFLVGLIIIGGIKRIATVTEKMVPAMAIIYITACLIIIFMHLNYVDDCFRMIFTEAFTPRAGLGGLVGVLIIGFRRAAFSNEAGAGSASIAHSAVKTRYPASEGIVSLLEPFIDTVVICTMTAIVIIIYNQGGVFNYGTTVGGAVIINETGAAVKGVDLTSMAFDDNIPHFSYVLTIAVFLFALSTQISWSYYGLQAWKYLFGRGKTADMIYKFLFLGFVILGASISLGAVTQFSDAMILAMVFPNMIGLLFLFPRVREELNRYLVAIKNFKKNNKK